MRSVMKPLAFGGAMLMIAAVAALSPRPARSAPGDGISLLQTLAEWTYPGAKPLGEASMSDGGDPSVQSVRCKATLTTPDPIAKVIAYYADKFGTGGPGGERGAAKGGAKSVSVQDDSQGRPVAIRVIVVNKGDAATTLVISRAEGEKETHIAWSHYLRLAGK